MSYDITIAADTGYSRSTPVDTVRDVIARLPGIRPNGSRGFALDIEGRLWMEIDLEAVTKDGDILDENDYSPTVNCVRMSIPYPMLGDRPERDYFPTALSISDGLGWVAIDDQTGEPIPGGGDPDERRSIKAPWWKFW